MSAYPQCYQENKYSLPIPNFKNVVNDNSVNSNSLHTWSNQTGYGNITYVNTNNQQKNQVYNRIKPLKAPYHTLVDTSLAWEQSK